MVSAVKQTDSRPASILVVDDEEDLCWVLQQALQAAGYAVTTTARGTVAAALAEQHLYAAAFLDARLRDMDGLELARLVRRKSPRTALVLISGYLCPEDEVVAECLHNGLFIDFVAKPFDLDRVRRLARRAAELFGKGG
jgi:DNA-binding NtrC family response regulator